MAAYPTLMKFEELSSTEIYKLRKKDNSFKISFYAVVTAGALACMLPKIKFSHPFPSPTSASLLMFRQSCQKLK